MVAVDFLFVLGLAGLSRMLGSTLLLACGLPALLSFNYLFLRRKPKIPVMELRPEEPAPRQPAFSLYACSAIFFVGTLIGLVRFAEGELPWELLPLLLVPLSLAIYLLRVARRAGVRKPK
jgi:hypothetical protein